VNSRLVRVGGRPIYGSVKPLAGSQRPKRKPINTLKLRVIALIVIIVVFAWGVWHVFEITSVTVDAPVGQQSSIQTEVLKLVHGSIGQGNLLTINPSSLQSDLQQENPSIKTVDVRRQWLHGLVVTVTINNPGLGWSSNNERYLLDMDGTVIGPLPTGSTLAVVTDDSNLPVSVGEQVVPPDFITFVQQLVPQLTAMGIGTQGLDVVQTTYDLTVTTNKGYKLIFDTTREASAEISDLKAVEAVLVSQNKTPSQYIDLRIAGKAYYQ
jgi:cell division septal protein FtsQ